MVPPPNSVRDSRHVAIRGLPHSTSDESLRTFLGRFGRLHGDFSRVESQGQEVIYASFTDNRSAAHACTAERFDKNSTCRITLCNPDERKRPPDPSNFVAYIVVFDIPVGPSAQDVFEAVKAHSKRHGTPTHINLDSSGVESGWWKARVTFVKLNTEELKADESLILGKPPQFQISRLKEPPNSHPLCTPSTSSVREASTSTSVHVPNPENHNRAYFERRFQKYGHVLEVQLLSTRDRHPFAIVQFGSCDHSRRALRDSDFPKPLDGPSRRSSQIVVFGLPKVTAEPDLSMQYKVHLRRLADNIVDIKLDVTRKIAIIYFDNSENAALCYDKLKAGVKHAVTDYNPDFDYCSDLLDSYLFPNAPRIKQKMQNKSTESDRRPRERTRSGKSPTVSSPRRSRTTEPQPSTSRAEESDPDDSNGSRLERSSENDNHTGDSHQNGVHDASRNHRRPSTILLSDESPDYSSSPFAQQGTSYDQSESAEASTQEQEQDDGSSDNSSSRSHRRREDLKSSGSAPSVKSSNSVPPDKAENEPLPNKKRRRRKKESDSEHSVSPEPLEKPSEKKEESGLSEMLSNLRWKSLDLSRYPKRIDEVVRKSLIAREIYEKATGRPFPKFTREHELKLENHLLYDRAEHSTDPASSETEIRQREWTRYCEAAEGLDEFRSSDTAILLRNPDPATPMAPMSRGSGRPSIEEVRNTRLSLDLAHHPHELAQRSNSLCIGPMTPLTPFHSVPPLLVNTSTPGPSQPGPSGVMTPRSAQPLPLASPISRHGSVSSSSGRPASIQTLRHHSVMFPPDTTIPPPPVPPTHDEMMSAPPTRRSSETLAPMPLRSPPFGKQIPPLLTMPLPPNAISGTPTGTHSVSSSATSTPRHSISGTPVHHEATTPKIQQSQTPKTRPPEKVQVRHDSISKPLPSSAASALQARSQSVSEPKKVDRVGELYNSIMSNTPSNDMEKMTRIPKKPSALLNNAQNQQNVPSTPSGSVNTPALSTSVKDKEKEKRRKERELEREREARKEMKRNETKEDRQKRKEKERAEREKKEEEERRERKREKQLKKEKEKQREEKERREREERERQKEKERRRAEKKKSKKKRRRDSDTDSSESDSEEEEVKKPKTQEEKDHELALLFAPIAERKSRRSGVKHGSEQEKSKRRVRVLIDSSDDSGDDNDKKKSGSSNDENSDTEQRPLPPPPAPPSIPVQLTKDQKQKIRKEREKGELTTSSEEEDGREEEERREKEQKKIREREDRENRKRQKSLTNYSSDDHNDRGKAMKKKKKRDDSEEKMRKKTWELNEQKQRKRKLEHRRSSENESKRKAKPDDFRDVPLEDVSDEEEVEEASRVRRPSTSSVASTNEKKSAKTPLRVVTPSVTPLQSPKILSPKILSPKTSSSSTKRPSISDQESLVSLTSPKQRNRTTSSTSTATTASRPEVPIPEKVLSPPVTAKSSVSSIDDLAIREDLSATSAAASPMSTTGRPVILTKAAMKAFNSSPPKQRSHETDSSGSSSSTDSSEDSADETIVSANKPADATEEAAGLVDRDQSPLVIPPPPVPPLIPPPPPPPVLEVPASTDVVEPVPSPQTPLPASVEPLVDSTPSPKEPEQDVQQSFSPKHAENLEHSQDTSDQDETMVQESGDVDGSHVEETGVSEKIDPISTEQPAEEVLIKAASPVENDEAVVPVSDDFMSPGPQDVERNETASTQPQSLISDQETDQAVQSIFNEEDEEDFPQYPDFPPPLVMPKGSKDEKESPQNSDEYNVALEPNRKTSEPLELDNAIASIVEQNESPTPGNHNDCRSSTSNYFNEEKRQELLRSMKGSENRTPRSDDNEVVETDREIPMEEMNTQEVFDNSKAKKKNSGEKQANASTLFAQHSRLSHPEQTPTPELIPNEAIHEDGRAGNEDLRVQTQRQFQQNHLQELQSPKFYTEQLLQSPSQGNSAGSNVSAGRPVPVQHPEAFDASQYIQNACLQSNLNGPSREELAQVFQREAEESSQLQKRHAAEVEQQKKLESSQRERTLSDLENLMNGKKAPVGGFMHYLNPAAQTIFSSLNIDPFRARTSLIAKEPLSTSSGSEQIDGLFIQRWFYRYFPIMWTGRLALKSMETSINLHYLTGRQQFLKSVLGSDNIDEKPRRESVRITQRLRLDNGQLQHIHGILNNPDFACCIGLTSTSDVDSLANGDSVQSSIIEYLNKKQYAGISCLNNGDALSTARVHVFAPGPLVTQYLSELCPTLLDYVHKTNVNFLLIVFTNDMPEPSAKPPCTPSDQIVVE